MDTAKIKDIKKGEFAYEGKAFFPLFNQEIEVYIDFDVPMDYADTCVEHLENLKDCTIDGLCKGAVNYCEEFRDLLEEIDVAVPEGIQDRDILQYIYPQIMIIRVPQGNEPAFHFECNCEWEPEHGLEWTVRGDETLYVGGFGDERPWSDREYFKNASWNYAELE